MKDYLLLIHPTLGVFGLIAVLWVFVEVFNVDNNALRRMKIASLTAAVLILLTWPAGGVWDSFFYEADRAVLEQGSWAFIGDTVMETKEHLFVVVLLLSFYLPVVVFRAKLQTDKGARLLTMTVAGLMVLTILAMEASGAFLGLSVKVGLFDLLGA